MQLLHFDGKAAYVFAKYEQNNSADCVTSLEILESSKLIFIIFILAFDTKWSNQSNLSIFKVLGIFLLLQILQIKLIETCL